MDSVYLTKYLFKSADSDYETMKVLYNNKKNTRCLFIGHLVLVDVAGTVAAISLIIIAIIINNVTYKVKDKEE